MKRPTILAPTAAALMAACANGGAQVAEPVPGAVVEPHPTTTSAPEPVPEDTTVPESTTTATSEPARRPPISVTTTTVAESQTDDEWWASQPGYDGSYPSGLCGGDLPPCWVLRIESGGDITAVNWGGCGGWNCYGKWQFDPRTSRGLGYPLTMDQYPEQVQDEAARRLWNGGRGCSHWAAC